ncbi:MAG: excalibur calcium-binding domain-containing protein [Lysobacter sp.]|nr:excalibur calcium-binding domain-containing protein [Lysobacter sp.]
MNIFRIAALLALATACGHAAAHGGGLNAQGCHNDRKNGGYHCHSGSSAAPAPYMPPALKMRNSLTPAEESSVYYANCTAVRAAGADPVRRGEPGYASHLDRDNDGVGCE